MEEIEVPLEKSEEDIHEHAHHAKERWVGWAALTSALLAALAAVTALQAGHHVNEAGILQTRVSDKWNEYQAKKEKSLAVESRDMVLESNGKPVPQADRDYLKRHGEDEKELKAEAEEMQKEVDEHIARHTPFSYGVTMFQVAIAVVAVSVLSKKPAFFFVSLGFGAVGIFFFVKGLI